MRAAVTVVRDGVLAIALWLAGAAVGVFATQVVWSLGLIPAVLVGGALTAAGIYLCWQNRYVAFASGLFTFAFLSTAMTMLIEWGASGLD